MVRVNLIGDNAIPCVVRMEQLRARFVLYLFVSIKYEAKCK